MLQQQFSKRHSFSELDGRQCFQESQQLELEHSIDVSCNCFLFPLPRVIGVHVNGSTVGVLIGMEEGMRQQQAPHNNNDAFHGIVRNHQPSIVFALVAQFNTNKSAGKPLVDTAWVPTTSWQLQNFCAIILPSMFCWRGTPMCLSGCSSSKVIGKKKCGEKRMVGGERKKGE